MAKSAIGFGSNLGDSVKILNDSRQILAQTSGIKLLSLSSWYKTIPIGPPQPDYINACAVLEVELTPLQLLETLLKIEQQFSRTRTQRWGPRTLDLDLLLFEDLIFNSNNLQIPHPRLRERAFVLVPLAEIAPDWIEPVSGVTIAKLLQQVDTSGVHRL